MSAYTSRDWVRDVFGVLFLAAGVVLKWKAAIGDWPAIVVIVLGALMVAPTSVTGLLKASKWGRGGDDPPSQ